MRSALDTIETALRTIETLQVPHNHLFTHMILLVVAIPAEAHIIHGAANAR